MPGTAGAHAKPPATAATLLPGSGQVAHGSEALHMLVDSALHSMYILVSLRDAMHGLPCVHLAMAGIRALAGIRV